MATALTDSSRLMVLSGEVALAMEGLGQFQDASAETLNDPVMAAAVTRFSTSVDAAANLNHIFRRALMEMAGPPSGPVHLSLPHDALVGELDVAHEPIDQALWHAHAIDRAMALRALLPLANEKPARIAILAGAGVEHAGAAKRLIALAERFSIPIATTLRAKGVIPEDHPMSLGVFGYAGTRHATEALFDPDLDLLIVLGSGLNERDTMHWSARLKPQARPHQRQSLAARARPGDRRRSFGGRRCRRLHRTPVRTADHREPRSRPGLRARSGSPRFAPARASTTPKISKAPPSRSIPTRVVGALRKALAARRHRARRLGRASRLCRPLLRFIHAAHLSLRDQSRADGLGRSGICRCRLCAARHTRGARDGRWLHADARHRYRGRRALSPAGHLRRPQQFGARQCLAESPQARACAGRTHQHSRS